MNTWKEDGKNIRVSRMTTAQIKKAKESLEAKDKTYGLAAGDRKKWVRTLTKELEERAASQPLYCLYPEDEPDELGPTLQGAVEQAAADHDGQLPESVALHVMELSRIDEEMEAQCALETLLDNLGEAYVNTRLATRYFCHKDLPASVRKQFYKAVADVCRHFPVSLYRPTGEKQVFPVSQEP